MATTKTTQSKKEPKAKAAVKSKKAPKTEKLITAKETDKAPKDLKVKKSSNTTKKVSKPEEKVSEKLNADVSGEQINGPRKKILQGVVVSTKSKKTAVVKVERKQKHSFYKKTITSHKKYHVHDEKELTKDGNVVKIIACRPISALKK